MTALLVFVLALSFSTSSAFATDNNTNSSIKNTTTTTAKIAAGSPTSFTSSQINNAATKVKNYVSINKKLPSYVTINKVQVTMPQFLSLITKNVIHINNGAAKSITLTDVKNASTATETVKTGTLSKTDYISLAKTINSYIKTNGKAPSYVTTKLGKIKFQNLIYTFSKILNFKSENGRLPNSVSVKPWNVLTSKTASEGGLRPIYIISDLINSNSVDNTRINTLVSELKKLGLIAYNMGVGTDNIGILQNSKIPSNALIVQICGGACAGTIKEVGTTWYKNLVGSKKLFYVWTSGATKITGLAWLPRAHDDNFSPASFTGLAHPDQYLLNNGYQYFEGYTNSQAATLAKLLYQAAQS
jgi:Pseudomurein-binding repeat